MVRKSLACVTTAFGVCVCFCLLAAAARAQSAAAFASGRTFSYIVSAGAGGGYDLYGRLTAEFMQRHLPGSTFVVRNMPGAGHLIGANALYASPADGYTLGTFSTGLIYNQISKNTAVRFDLAKMSWIGKAGSDPRVVVIAAHSPIKTFDEFLAQKEPLNFATSGLGSASYIEMLLLSNTMKMPIRILTGYSGNADQLAMRRGEIAGTIGSRSSLQHFVDNGYGRFIAQIGGREPEPPQLSQWAKDERAANSVALIQSQGDIARLTAGPPGVPAARLALLIDAYRKAMNDSDLQARAEKFGYPIEPAYGEEVAQIVARALRQPDEIVATLTQALKDAK
jgi:tripartite-type tricarboxylate transporter receptor subunit TctC